jgi:hypothetical protein
VLPLFWEAARPFLLLRENRVMKKKAKIEAQIRKYIGFDLIAVLDVAKRERLKGMFVLYFKLTGLNHMS